MTPNTESYKRLYEFKRSTNPDADSPDKDNEILGNFGNYLGYKAKKM